jgi:hypothetical protein
MLAKNVLTARKPPAEAPIPTTGKPRWLAAIPGSCGTLGEGSEVGCMSILDGLIRAKTPVKKLIKG